MKIIILLLLGFIASCYEFPFTDVEATSELMYAYDFQALISEYQGMETCTAPTTHCQSTNEEITKLAKELTTGKTAYNGAVAIYDYVRDKIAYEAYSNTKYGAVTTLNNKKGNCCDQAHLMNALMRAAGHAAYYRHGTCKFHRSGATEGHVWSEVLVDGKWYIADGTSSQNSFGVINSWTLITDHGSYCSLPF